jgi:hypothetical protein
MEGFIMAHERYKKHLKSIVKKLRTISELTIDDNYDKIRIVVHSVLAEIRDHHNSCAIQNVWYVGLDIYLLYLSNFRYSPKYYPVAGHMLTNMIADMRTELRLLN